MAGIGKTTATTGTAASDAAPRAKFVNLLLTLLAPAAKPLIVLSGMNLAGGIMRASWKRFAAAAALSVSLAVPTGVVVAQTAPTAPTLTLMAQAGAFTGKWVYRSFSVSAKSNETLAKLALGLNELTLTEGNNGAITGQRTGQGVTYDVTGVARYAPKVGATIVLHGTATIAGKSYNYDYFGYLMPSWGVGSAQPPTIMGTVLRSDPTNPSNAPLIASFSATKEQ